MKPRIALVQGDATGIGPELMAKLLALDDVRERADILVLSDPYVFAEGCRVAEIEHDLRVVGMPEEADYSDRRPNLLDVPVPAGAEFVPGRVSEQAGRAVLACFGRALDLAAADVVDGVCFMPFNKEAMHKAGLGTEDELQWAKAHLGSEERASEFNVIDGMWNARVTSHVPLREVADLLSVELIVDAVRLADRTMKGAGFERPRIAVAASPSVSCSSFPWFGAWCRPAPSGW